MEFYGLTLFSEHTLSHRGLIQRRERQLMTLALFVSGGDSTLHKTNFSRVAVHSHPLLPFFKKYILFVVMLRCSEAKKQTKQCIKSVRCEALFVLCSVSLLRGFEGEVIEMCAAVSTSVHNTRLCSSLSL